MSLVNDMSDPEYSFTSPRKQLFAFPPDVISSMLENPSSPKGLMKLYQTCKYFYGKRPILIIKIVSFVAEKDFFGFPIEGANFRCWIGNENVSDLKVPIWLTKSVWFDKCFAIDQRLPELFRCSVEYINVFDESFLQFEDLVRLTSEKTVRCFNTDCFIYHSDMKKATIDEVLQLLPNVTDFQYFIDKNCSLEILQKLNEIKLNHQIEDLVLYLDDFHPTFDINLFCDFLTNNTTPDGGIKFMYFPELMDKLKVVIQKLDPQWETKVHERVKEIINDLKAESESEE